MYCPNCKQEYDGKFCPECGTKLIEKPATSGVSLNLGGDANAISGGLHVSDSHDVSNVDNSVHNITNNTSTVNNITQVSAQKTEREILQEHKTQFLNACKRAYEDNVLEQREVVELEELRIKMGLDKTTADNILESVRVMSDRNARKSELNPIAKTKLKILTSNLQKNEVKALMDQIDSLEPLVRRFDHDELSRKYYLVLAALKPEKCIEQKERTKTDTYWEAFWCYLAYIKAGRLIDAEETLASLDHFSSYPEDNMTVLAAAGALMRGSKREAKEYLDAVTGEYTPALQRFVDSLNLLLVPQKAKKTGADENTCAFYLVNFFGQKDPKVKAEEERIRKAKEEEEAKRKAREEEAKRKAKEAEEARKRAEEERRRIEAERKAKEEAIRKAKEAEEAKRRAEEAKRRAEAEAIRKAKEAEEAKRRREEEERKRQAEEAERRRKEEERRKKEAVAWNVLQSCSNEDIEKYGISIISFAQGKKPIIYYRGYTFECQEEITKIKSHLDVESFSKLIAVREGKGIFEVKDYIRKDFETYYKENSKTLANSDNIITFCSESDLYKLWRNKREVHVYRMVQEMQLLPYCFDANEESVYSLEYQNFFCDAELGGGVYEVLQTGFLGGHRDNLKEMDLGVDSEPILKKLSSFEGFTHLVLGTIVQYKILNRTYEDDIVLLGVLPFDINAEIWVNGRYRDNLKLLESNTTIPCTKTKTIVDDNCSSIIISMLGKRFALNVPKLFGYVPKSFEITLSLEGFSDFKFTLKDKASKKEVSLQNEELFNYEEDGLNEHIHHKREAEEAERRAEAEAKRRAEEEARKRAEEAKRRAEEEARRKAKEAEEAKRKAAFKTYNGHECVDLGLPSGTLWATCNIGASKPEESGNYFSWGETTGYDEGKREFDDEHYKFREKKWNLLGFKWIYTKYVENSKNGNVDNKLTLDKEDDAAHVQWGEGWRMPTTAQFEELINPNYTTQELISKAGVTGLMITSKANGNSLFFPEAGYFFYDWTMELPANNWEKKNYRQEKGGKYWTRDRLSGPYKSLGVYEDRKDHDDCANSLTFGWSEFDNKLYYHLANNQQGGRSTLHRNEVHSRCFGYSIRPVHSKE